MHRRFRTSLRVARALSFSLALHGLGWAALREWPVATSHATRTAVELTVAWADVEPPLNVAALPTCDEESAWVPMLLDVLPEVEPPQVVPPIVYNVFAEPPVERDDEPQPSPFWDNVRRDLAGALKWPAGCRGQTNVEVRILAIRDGLLPLAPISDELDPVRHAVRRAVEHVVRRAARPPEDLVGRDMRLIVRFESRR